MTKKLLKNIHDDNGNTKIDVDEIAKLLDGSVVLLGELIEYERGSNDNGDYLIFPNGFAICSFQGVPAFTDQQSGSVYRSDSLDWYYPLEFVNVLFANAQADTTNRWTTYRPLLNRVQFRQYAHTSSNDGVSTNFIAFGWIR